MPIEVSPCATADEIVQAITPVFHYFGMAPSPRDYDRFLPFVEPSRAFMAREGGAAVGGCASFPFELTVPGGTVRAAGLSVVGVLPTHRRRGILRSMMRAQLDDVHRRGEAVGYLWASEDTIYGQFGYGLASLSVNLDIARTHSAFARPFESRGEFRMVDEAAALEPMAQVYDRVRREQPGMFARSDEWWRNRRLADPEHRRMGGGVLNRVVLSYDGRPEGYALYRIHQEFDAGSTHGHVNVVEAVGATDEATRDLWRFLFDIDWEARIKAALLPVDHPLILLVARPRELKLRAHDGVWVRLVDVAAALAARRFAAGEPVVIEVGDAFCPWNAGRWRVSASGVERVSVEADLACDVTALGSAYLGGFTFRQLARAGRVEQRRTGALAKADALFAGERAVWCPEIF
uniref:GNAT family N-acetyltransferase n=1 Tax=Eiseniibacteriota bacterium TaxID=2212470 RepID=A0A832I179_UNCEI